MNNMSALDNFTPQQTQNGSFTFFSEKFDEAFHSHYGARQETYLKFVLPSQVQRAAENGRLATYSCAAAVRTALLAAGLVIGSTIPIGRHTPGTIAAYPINESVDNWGNEREEINLIPYLSQSEKEHLQTRAAIPYRDPELRDSAEVIIIRREQEQKDSVLETTSQWKKRWN